MPTVNVEQLREERLGYLQRSLFQHQIDAIAKLRNVINFPSAQYRGALLVLPTGAGKTYTTVRWLNDYVFPKGVKVVWLAHTFHLLDQALETIWENAQYIQGRSTLNIRLISSHPSHEKVPSIDSASDDMVIMSTQTAIRHFNLNATDAQGNAAISNFRKLVDYSKGSGLLLVLDEAHHAPAYGCRNLLTGIRELVPNLQILGLTATPTYTDETRRGWLKRIFDQGVIYQAKQPDLIAANILARPKFIPMPTGRDYEVNDELYNRLMREHKDLPEYIIERLATDQVRNDYIVNEYLTHKEEYGKTILFADRWFQCVYLKEKLLQRGVKADAVYSHIDADPGSAEARNRRTTDDNKRILEQFKYGKGAEALDVLINVRMLTEGTDVPTVKTVFVTRQTTSSILLTQMIGRALRGKLAGGGSDKSEANIVLFIDNWKRGIIWARPNLEGGEEGEIAVRGYYPLEYISIRLIEELSRQINSGKVIEVVPFSTMMPVGWCQTQIVVDCSEGNNDDIEAFTEFVMVYEHTKPKFDRFIEGIPKILSDEWSKENLSEDWITPQVDIWITEYFDLEDDNIGNTLTLDITRVARHVAQNQTRPTYYPFEERDNYDLDKVASSVLDQKLDDFEQDDLLENLFSRPGSLWKTFYRTLDRFKTALFGAKQRELRRRKGEKGTKEAGTLPPTVPPRKRELTGPEKARIKHRDGNKCLACGGHGRGVKLEIDHISPVIIGGLTDTENSQTLCSVCNRQKAINEMNFRYNETTLTSARDLTLLPRNGSEDVKRSITRLVNFFYCCQAVCKVVIHERSSGSCYSLWRIELYPGNEPEWLLAHKEALVKHIREDFGYSHVTDLQVS